MKCRTYNYSINPGMGLIVTGRNLQEIFRHCPYCLEIIASDSEASQEENRTASFQRRDLRKETREKFVDRLLADSLDGQLRCPVCEHKLNENDERLLRNSEYFKCHLCGHDLANRAYKKEVFHAQRWLPVVVALGDLVAEKKCEGCCYFGAIAKACQAAFSWMPETESKPTHQIANMLRRTDWKEPECVWGSCFAVKQYRRLAGEALALL